MKKLFSLLMVFVLFFSIVSCDALDGRTKIIDSLADVHVLTVHTDVFRLDYGVYESKVSNRYYETIPATIVVSEEHGIEVFFNFTELESHNSSCYRYDSEVDRWDPCRCEDHAPVKE